MSERFWIIALCGLGTFLLRCIPLWHARRRSRLHTGAAALQRWLAGVGPAAIAALLVVSLWDALAAADARVVRAAMVFAALGMSAATRRLLGGGIAMPTLAGALAYGILAHIAATVAPGS
ncbi:MAG: AzlD domain-containing protein [Burkholderiaceae bacterium]|jgi:branched-subunit amino acid transport protein|nr:AzlD domain-containing protein [Burkholderiaceae bacterium]